MRAFSEKREPTPRPTPPQSSLQRHLPTSSALLFESPGNRSIQRTAETARNNDGVPGRQNTRHQSIILSATVPQPHFATQTDSDGSKKPPSDPRSPRPGAVRDDEAFSFYNIPPVDVPAQWDALRTTLTYDPQITNIAPPRVPTDFGRTDTRIEVNKSSATQATGVFNVELYIDNVITYWVDGGTRRDIASDSDPKITQANYPDVVRDLTPSPAPVNAGGTTLYRNQPPRRQFWARDLTVKHELFHADENEKFGLTGAIEGREWLNRQTARTYDDVGRLLGTVSQIVARRILTAMAPPGVEQRAYNDGAPEYRRRAQAIRIKGDANGYAPRPPAQQGSPRRPSPQRTP